MNTETITIDLSSWTRLQEVENYAKHHGVPIEDAIRALVNAGLTHEPRLYL